MWLDAANFPDCDSIAKAWDYDRLRTAILDLTTGRRFNLQETVAHEIYDMVAARRGVTGLRVSTRKPDIYPDCAAVGGRAGVVLTDHNRRSHAPSVVSTNA